MFDSMFDGGSGAHFDRPKRKRTKRAKASRTRMAPVLRGAVETMLAWRGSYLPPFDHDEAVAMRRELRAILAVVRALRRHDADPVKVGWREVERALARLDRKEGRHA
jgi:hypothetical protein